MVILINETQKILSFLKIFKFNIVMYYPIIIILKEYYYIYFMCKN